MHPHVGVQCACCSCDLLIHVSQIPRAENSDAKAFQIE